MQPQDQNTLAAIAATMRTSTDPTMQAFAPVVNGILGRGGSATDVEPAGPQPVGELTFTATREDGGELSDDQLADIAGQVKTQFRIDGEHQVDTVGDTPQITIPFFEEEAGLIRRYTAQGNQFVAPGATTDGVFVELRGQVTDRHAEDDYAEDAEDYGFGFAGPAATEFEVTVARRDGRRLSEAEVRTTIWPVLSGRLREQLDVVGTYQSSRIGRRDDGRYTSAIAISAAAGDPDVLVDGLADGDIQPEAIDLAGIGLVEIVDARIL